MPTPAHPAGRRLAAALCALPGLVLAMAAAGQDAGKGDQEREEQKRLVELRDRKLTSGFLREARWFVDFTKAKAAAKAKGQPILIYFTRSYAPSPACEAVEEKILSDPRFPALTENVTLFCHLSTRVQTDPEQDLLARMGGKSIPFIVVTDSAGRRIAVLDRPDSVGDIQEMLSGPVAGFLAMEAAAAKGDKEAKARFFMARLQLGHLSPQEVEQELATAEYLSPEQKERVRSALASLEVMEILASIDAKDPRSRRAAAERMHAMQRAGRIPTPRYAFPFWETLLGHADQSADLELFETALDSIKKLPGGRLDPDWLRRWETKLRALRFMKGRDKK